MTDHTLLHKQKKIPTILQWLWHATWRKYSKGRVQMSQHLGRKWGKVFLTALLNLSLKPPPSHLFREDHLLCGFGAGLSFMKMLLLQGLRSEGSVGICDVQRIPSLAASFQAEKRNLVSISHSYWNATIWLWKWKAGLSCVCFFSTLICIAFIELCFSADWWRAPVTA